MACRQQSSVGEGHRSLFPVYIIETSQVFSVHYCNISSFQSRVKSHVDMTPASGMLNVFAYKNEQVVQIRIQVSHVGEFGGKVHV